MVPKTEPEIIDLLDDSGDEEDEIKVERDTLISGIDLTSGNYISCPICYEQFASHSELGTHVVNHSNTPPNSAATSANSSLPNDTLEDQNRVERIRQAFQSSPSTALSEDGKAIFIFTRNPNIYFEN